MNDGTSDPTVKRVVLVWSARAVWLLSIIFAASAALTIASEMYEVRETLQNLDPDNQHVDPSQVIEGLHELGLTTDHYALYGVIVYLATTLVFAVAGAVIFWVRPVNWLTFVYATGFTLASFNFHTIDVIALSQTWQTVLNATGPLGFLFLFSSLYWFPNGKLEPQRYRFIILLFLVVLMVVFLLPVQSSLLVYQLPEWVIPLILAAIALGPLLAQVYRYRNVATPTDRQQTKVVVLGLGAIVSFYIMYLITDAIFWNAVRQSPSLIVLYSFSSEATVILTGLLPVSIVAAILRYHLWDVDIIIRRTITYSVVSVLLVTAYFSIVLLAQRVLGGIISSDNSLVMMISTLVVAALFNPLRERVQRTVDRLFYRKRYNAEATLESFRDNIRDAVEPEAIQGHLVQTISSTIQPTTISFWGIDRQ